MRRQPMRTAAAALCTVVAGASPAAALVDVNADSVVPLAAPYPALTDAQASNGSCCRATLTPGAGWMVEVDANSWVTGARHAQGAAYTDFRYAGTNVVDARITASARWSGSQFVGLGATTRIQAHVEVVDETARRTVARELIHDRECEIAKVKIKVPIPLCGEADTGSTPIEFTFRLQPAHMYSLRLKARADAGRGALNWSTYAGACGRDHGVFGNRCGVRMTEVTMYVDQDVKTILGEIVPAVHGMLNDVAGLKAQFDTETWPNIVDLHRLAQIAARADETQTGQIQWAQERIVELESGLNALRSRVTALEHASHQVATQQVFTAPIVQSITGNGSGHRARSLTVACPAGSAPLSGSLVATNAVGNPMEDSDYDEHIRIVSSGIDPGATPPRWRFMVENPTLTTLYFIPSVICG